MSRLNIAKAYYESMSWAYVQAVEEQQRLNAMLADNKSRRQRLLNDKNIAWRELEALSAGKREGQT